MRATEVAADRVGLKLFAVHEAAHVGHQIEEVSRGLAADGVGLDVLVQQLVGIELRAVARKKEDAQATLVLREPRLGNPRPVDRVPVQDEEDLPPDLAHQPFQKLEEHRCPELFFKDHEVQPPSVRDSGDHVAAKPPSRTPNDRRPAASTIGPPGGVVRSHPRLIAPVNLGLFPQRLCPDGGIALLQPPLDFLRLLLEGAANGLLRREPPSLQVPACRPNGKGDPELRRDQVPHRLPRPEKELERKLVRRPANDLTPPPGRLIRGQLDLGRTTAPPRPKRLGPFVPDRTHPTADRLARHSEYAGSLDLAHARPHCRHRFPSQILLGSRWERTRVLDHGPTLSCRSFRCNLFYAPSNMSASSLPDDFVSEA